MRCTLGVIKVSRLQCNFSSANPAVANLGVRPTISNQEFDLRLEVHLLDFSGDLYEQELEIVFGEFIRREQRFDSVEELKAQITRDKESARRILR